MNTVVLSGNMGADPELSYHGGKSGQEEFAICKIRFCNEVYAGQGKPYTKQWFNAEAFGGLATYVAEHFQNGNRIWVKGKLLINKYENERGPQERMVIRLEEIEKTWPKREG